jgi:cytochrome P450
MTELWDPFSHQLHDDPYPVYQALRDEHPLYFCETRKLWALSRFSDVWDSVNNPGLFSSQMIYPGYEDTIMSKLPFMIMTDPPRHDQLRALVRRAFTPRVISRLEPAIRTIAAEFVDDIVAGGGGDLTQMLAMPLPAIVIADLLGVPREDREEFRQWGEDAIQNNPDDPAVATRAAEGLNQLVSYFKGLIEERRESPRDDFLTDLIAAEVDGERLDEWALLGMCIHLLLAGTETTTNLISNSAMLLTEHRDVWARILADPGILPQVIEECLRFDSPVQALSRTVTADCELHGRQMRQGDQVILLFGSACRDEREFDHADVFDVDRRFERHLGFGHGLHFCLGAPLARLEVRVVYEELAAKAPGLEVSGPGVRMHSVPMRGMLHLPVTV